MMLECRKRQVERRAGEVHHKCINKESEAYRTYVDSTVCGACPVRVMLEQAETKFARQRPLQLPVINDTGYPSCEFRINKGEMTCGVTGLPTDADICNRCAKDSKTATPNLLDKVVSYSKAVRKWVAAGRPERTQEEVQQIYDEHCSKCSMFDRKKNVCNSCGCPANTDQPPLRNKLKMATEACPLGRFPAKVQENG